MGIITRMQKQKAIRWPLTGTNSYGQPTWGTPVEITCRWEDRVEESIDVKGEVQRSGAVIYVGVDLEVGDRLMLGELTSEVSSDPQEEESWEVQRFEKMPNLRAREFLRTAHLTRVGG